ncbi:hypothetical protein LGK95_18560 [Clostridium algoriphilum]|uniref:DUF6116 family protein n=1 Tax=Clostridium algoriphilum TaxID=198347 RepID=UPI001CF5A949|nr:DUF6116 family protein [Clostridium algoriphilum]MCB2295488.1 hypothetical protein [Clostridium algoriphilum]
MLSIILLIVVVIVYLKLPAKLEAILFIINIFIPDPIPYLDEVLMVLPIIIKIKKAKSVKKIER